MGKVRGTLRKGHKHSTNKQRELNKHLNGTINTFGTETGRLQSKEPNVPNHPAKTSEVVVMPTPYSEDDFIKHNMDDITCNLSELALEGGAEADKNQHGHCLLPVKIEPLGSLTGREENRGVFVQMSEEALTESHRNDLVCTGETSLVKLNRGVRETYKMEKISGLNMLKEYYNNKFGLSENELYVVKRRTINELKQTKVEELLEEVEDILHEDYHCDHTSNYEALVNEFGDTEYHLFKYVETGSNEIHYCKSETQISEETYKEYLLLRLVSTLLTQGVAKETPRGLVFRLGKGVNALHQMGLDKTIKYYKYTHKQLVRYLYTLVN